MHVPDSWKKLFDLKGSVPWDSVILFRHNSPRAEFRYLWATPFTQMLGEDEVNQLCSDLDFPTLRTSIDQVWEYQKKSYNLRIQINGTDTDLRYVLYLQNAKEAENSLNEITYADFTNEPQIYLDLYA